jgi:hypothetical protein
MGAIFEFHPLATAFVMRRAEKFITLVRWSLIVAASRFLGSPNFCRTSDSLST